MSNVQHLSISIHGENILSASELDVENEDVSVSM